jgi:hypothetical protein
MLVDLLCGGTEFKLKVTNLNTSISVISCSKNKTSKCCKARKSFRGRPATETLDYSIPPAIPLFLGIKQKPPQTLRTWAVPESSYAPLTLPLSYFGYVLDEARRVKFWPTVVSYKHSGQGAATSILYSLCFVKISVLVWREWNAPCSS